MLDPIFFFSELGGAVSAAGQGLRDNDSFGMFRQIFMDTVHFICGRAD